MNKRIALALSAILCMVMIATAAITVSATGEDGDSGNNDSSSSISSLVDSSSSTSTSSEQTGGNEDENDGDEEDNEDGKDEENNSSADSDKDEETETSSAASSSASSHAPIISDGGHGGNTFIEQDVSQLTSLNTGTTSSEAVLISSDYSEGTDEELEHYVARATTIANDIYKVIWIPILLIVLCIAALVIVNVMFRKKYPKTAKSGASRRVRSSSHEAPKRRKR